MKHVTFNKRIDRAAGRRHGRRRHRGKSSRHPNCPRRHLLMTRRGIPPDRGVGRLTMTPRVSGMLNLDTTDFGSRFKSKIYRKNRSFTCESELPEGRALTPWDVNAVRS